MNAMDDYLDSMRRGVEEQGWMIQGVFPTDEHPGPPFAYTVGLAARGKAELIIFGVPIEAAGHILNENAEVDLAPGDEVAFGNGYVGRAVRVLDSSVHLTIANRLFGDPDKAPLDALQLVVPDAKNRLPWEDGYDLDPLLQPMLGDPV